ncbi:ASCH domain-containing protein [Cryobacterium sp. Y82]|uniref:ASCH domain-containing protein n=1 Tax=Cryobacterium sp. Y82 TaxID=2045017 RepID=UPI0018EA9DB5|nr:ASCH domain-containing protein [Cryobacterium sp. Y82]
MTNIDSLPIAEVGFPGPLRDKLVSAICDGRKTSTTSFVAEYQIENEPLPQVGSRQAVVDSEGRRLVTIETTDVEQVRLSDVPWEHARDEGEGHSSLSEWRIAHERFWEDDELRAFPMDPTFVVDDNTLVVLERFRVLD